MADEGEHYEVSWILHHILDRMIGSRELVEFRRKMTLIGDNESSVGGGLLFMHRTGSMSEGFAMKGSDEDVMIINRTVEVMCSNQDIDIPSHRDMPIVVMRKADCRPCYVTLELVDIGQHCDRITTESIVPFRDRLFVSSEINAKTFQEELLRKMRMDMETHGPSSCLKGKCGRDCDIVHSYSCTGWPPQAKEWLSRSRQHGWPDKGLIYDISKSGCHVVPVGDKTSADTFLQWRISFVTAERKLIYSLSHEQFLVYGLLKLFLKEISEGLNTILEEVDILSSYILKTVIFFAVENAPKHVWKEQNTFLCFRLCLKILITWVNAGYCPNYFIVSNNMFQGKLHSGKQEKLRDYLMGMYNIKWMCLFVGRFVQPSIGVCIQGVRWTFERKTIFTKKIGMRT